VKGKPFSLADRDHIERQAGRLRLCKHARTFQEDKPWLAPGSETAKAANDLVVRAIDLASGLRHGADRFGE
jgi:hypothetical protein